ncbi:MAG: MFS transporter [Acidimicrobiaceae bacterium]|nr:MFS transporter [Acidimicrobiia bacterium]MCY4495070.1 MFS transporter [Acidimicrobiaceae bacterium]
MGPTGLAARFIRSDLGRGFIAFRFRAYRLIYASFVIQQIGFWMSHLTLQGLIEQRSGGDTLAITALFAALFMPALFVGPFGGVLADRVERKLVVTVSYFASAASAGGLALLTGINGAPPLWAIYTLAFILGTTFSLLGPSAGALVVNSVSSEAVQSAISLQAAAQNLTRVVGPIMAVQVIGSGRFHIGFTGFAAASALAGLLITRVVVDAHDVEMDGLGVFSRIRDGFRHARERKPALLAIATTGVASVFGVAHTALIPSFTREVLEQEPGQFAKVVAATGLGAIVGALTVGYSKAEPSLRRASISLLVYGVCLVGFTASEQLETAMAWQLGVGFCYFATMTTLQTLLQQVVSDSARGRVMSLFVISWGGVVWIGTLILGAMADSDGLNLGVRPTLLLTSGILIGYGLVVTLVSKGMPTGSNYPN